MLRILLTPPPLVEVLFHLALFLLAFLVAAAAFTGAAACGRAAALQGHRPAAPHVSVLR